VLLHSDISSTQGLDCALERQDLSCSYLAHHELESVIIYVIMYVIYISNVTIIIIITIITVTTIVTITIIIICCCYCCDYYYHHNHHYSCHYPRVELDVGLLVSKSARCNAGQGQQATRDSSGSIDVDITGMEEPDSEPALIGTLCLRLFCVSTFSAHAALHCLN